MSLESGSKVVATLFTAFCVLAVVSAKTDAQEAIQGTPQNSQLVMAKDSDVENETAKLSTETWEAYIDRLVTDSYLTDAQKEAWAAGEEVVAERPFSLTKYRQETRTRTVNVTRTRMEVRDGKEVSVPYTEQVRQVYTVNVPYAKVITCTCTLPVKGSKDDDVLFDGFLKADGKPVQTKPPKTPNTDPADAEKPKDPVEDSKKLADETWEQYLTRLVNSDYLSQAEFDQWKEGNSLTLEKDVTITQVRSEQRSRNVPREKKVVATDDAGKEVELTVTENVLETYVVQVPYMTIQKMVIDLPAPGVFAEDANFNGFMPDFKPSVSLPLDEQEAELLNRTTKTETETWEEYLTRLNNDRFITSGEIAKWKEGNTIKVQKEFQLSYFKKEERTRNITVMQVVKEVDEDGNEVSKNVPKTIEQTFVVAIPYQATKEGAFAIPGKGKREANSTNKGFIFRDLK